MIKGSIHPQICVKVTRWPTTPRQHQPLATPAAWHAGGGGDWPNLLSRHARIVTPQPGINCPCCTTACHKTPTHKPRTHVPNTITPHTVPQRAEHPSKKRKQAARDEPLSGRDALLQGACRNSCWVHQQQRLPTAQHLGVCAKGQSCPNACKTPTCRCRSWRGCKSCMQP